MTGQREQLGIRVGEKLNFDVVGKRHRGSFRKALRDYGFDRKEINAVIADLDADRETMIVSGNTCFDLRPL